MPSNPNYNIHLVFEACGGSCQTLWPFKRLGKCEINTISWYILTPRTGYEVIPEAQIWMRSSPHHFIRDDKWTTPSPLGEHGKWVSVIFDLKLRLKVKTQRILYLYSINIQRLQWESCRISLLLACLWKYCWYDDHIYKKVVQWKCSWVLTHLILLIRF